MQNFRLAGELRRRLARILPRLRRLAGEAALPGCRPFPPDRDHRRQLSSILLYVLKYCCMSAGAYAGQRPRRDLTDVCRHHAEIAACDARSGAHGLDFFRRQINRIGRLGHRQRNACRALLGGCSSRATGARLRGRGDFTGAWRCGELKSLPSARSGIFTAARGRAVGMAFMAEIASTATVMSQRVEDG